MYATLKKDLPQSLQGKLRIREVLQQMADEISRHHGELARIGLANVLRNYDFMTQLARRFHTLDVRDWFPAPRPPYVDLFYENELCTYATFKAYLGRLSRKSEELDNTIYLFKQRFGLQVDDFIGAYFHEVTHEPELKALLEELWRICGQEVHVYRLGTYSRSALSTEDTAQVDWLISRALNQEVD